MNYIVRDPFESDHRTALFQLDRRRRRVRAHALFERVVEGLTGLISRIASRNTEVLRFPPVMNRAHIEKSGYLQQLPATARRVSLPHRRRTAKSAAPSTGDGQGRRTGPRCDADRPRADAGRLLSALSAGRRRAAAFRRRPRVRRRVRLLPPRAVAGRSTGCSRSACANIVCIGTPEQVVAISASAGSARAWRSPISSA